MLVAPKPSMNMTPVVWVLISANFFGSSIAIKVEYSEQFGQFDKIKKDLTGSMVLGLSRSDSRAVGADLAPGEDLT